MTYLQNRDFLIDVALGNVAGHSLVSKFGHNAAVQTGGTAEDIWDAGGDWAKPTVARVHNITSTDADDTAAGTGARTLDIYGLDGSGNLQNETISMSGTTNSATSNSYTMIHRMVVATAGSSNSNEGTISATAVTDSTVTAQVAIGEGQTLMAIYEIPTGKTAYLLSWYAGTTSGQQSSESSKVQLMAMPSGGAWNTKHKLVFGSEAGGTTLHQHKFDAPSTFAAGTVLKARGEGDVDNYEISAGFDLLLIDD